MIKVKKEDIEKIEKRLDYLKDEKSNLRQKLREYNAEEKDLKEMLGLKKTILSYQEGNTLEEDEDKIEENIIEEKN